MELLDTKIERNGFIFYGNFSEGLLKGRNDVSNLFKS